MENGDYGPFTLTATLGGRDDSVILDESRTEVVFSAIREVLDRAAADPTGPWALGAIDLLDRDGDIVYRMEAK